MHELESYRNEAEAIATESKRLQAEITRLKDERWRTLNCDDDDSGNSDLGESSEPVEDYLAMKMKATQAEVAALIK